MKKILIVSLLFLSACKFSATRINNANDKAQAEKIVNDFYADLNKKQISDALNLMHPNLLRANDTAKLRQFLVGLSNQSSSLKERKLDHWETKIVQGLDASSFYALYYINTYNNMELKVSIALSKDENNDIKITGFQVDPNKFQNFNSN